MEETATISTVPYAQVIRGLPGGFHFPTRMTIVQLAAGELALISPVPIDEPLFRHLAGLGRVRFLIAPNLLHHLYLGEAARRYPEAKIIAPPGLAKKRPDLRIDHALDAELPAALAQRIEVVRIEGAPSLDEYALFERTSGTLILTDMVFNVREPRGFWANLILRVVGCHGRLAQSRVVRALFKDRAAAARSVERILALPIRSLVVAHGETVAEGAREALAQALRPLHPRGLALPAVC